MIHLRSFLIIALLIIGSFASIISIEGREVPRKVTSLDWHADSVVCVTWSPDGTLLVSGSIDGTVKVWNSTTMKAIKTMRGPERISTLEFDPTGSYIIAGGVFGEMIIWETLFFDHETTIYLSEYYFNEGIANNVDSISFSPDGELMAVGKFLSVKIYDVSSWTEIRELDLERGGINQVRFSPDGSQLLIGASPTLMENETVLSLWDTSMWIEIKNLSIPVFPNYRSVLSMEWNSGGTRIALGLDNVFIDESSKAALKAAGK